MTVDPTKRMTVSEVLDHPWTKRDTPRYLRRLHRRHAKPPLESLSTLLMDVSLANDPDFISGIGKLDTPIILELAEGIGVKSDDIRNALRLPGENAVKVAYSLCSDRKYRHDRE
jgi:carbon catabolite-derepressing protein kinase